MRFFVMGSSGYIGKPLLKAIASQGQAIGISSKSQSGLVQLRLESPDDFDYSMFHEGDVVFVTSAISSPDFCSKHFEEAWQINVEGTSEFVSKALSRGSKILFFSSDTVYGENTVAFDESAVCNPAGEYAVMKHEVEQRFVDNPHFKAVRLSYVFSKEDKFTRFLLDTAKKEVTVEAFHPFYRAVIYLGDVVEGVTALAIQWDRYKQSFFNFGGPEIINRPDFASTIKENAIPSLSIRQVEPPPDFFRNRPRMINMKSPLLAELLGRKPLSLVEAIQCEFRGRERS